MTRGLQELFEQVLQPLIAADGGRVELLDVSPSQVVTIRLSRACHGCIAQSHTVRGIIEPAVRKALGDHATVVVHAETAAHTPIDP
jgi:Fe-S cluster biogenesis protein NfuA